MNKTVVDCSGNLAERDRVKIVELTPEEVAAHEANGVQGVADQQRVRRDALLAASDYTQLDDSPVDKAVWRTYRQALRNHPLDGSPLPDPPES
jgi:hypothetical protein